MSERVHRITIELDADTYKRLVERAEASGFYAIKDYVVSIIRRALEEGEGGAEALDVDQLMSRLRNRVARMVQDELNKHLSVVSDLKNQVAGLYERVDELSRALEELRSREQVAPARQRAGRKSGIERLREEKVLFESSLPKYIQGDRFFKYLEREGAVVLPLKERVAVDPEYWREFKEALFSEIDTNDEGRIRERLGKQGYELFAKLRDEAVIYYDPKQRKWLPSSREYFK